MSGSSATGGTTSSGARGHDIARHYVVDPEGVVVTEVRGPLPPAYMPTMLDELIVSGEPRIGE